MPTSEALYEVKVPLLKLLKYHLFSNGGSVEATFYMGTFAHQDGDTVYGHGSVQIRIMLEADNGIVSLSFKGHPWYNTKGLAGRSVTTIPPATELGGIGRYHLGDLIYLCTEDGCLTFRVELLFESPLVAAWLGQGLNGTYVNRDRNGVAVESPTPITASDFALKFPNPNILFTNSLPSYIDLFPGTLFEANPPMTDWQVRAGTRVFHTHKVVLGAASDFFTGMFDASEMKEGRTGEVEVHGVPVESVEAFLTHIYRPAGIFGYITEGARASVLCDVYCLAHMYRVTRLVELCKMVFNFIKMDEGSLFNAFALLAEHGYLDSLARQCKAGKATYGDAPQFQDAICEAMTVNPTLAKDVIKRAITAECVPAGIWNTDDFANFIKDKDNSDIAKEILDSAISAKAVSAGFWESDGFAEFAKANFNVAIHFMHRAVTDDIFTKVMLKLYPLDDPSASTE